MAESTSRLSDYEKSQARYQELLGGSDKFKTLVEKQLGEKTDYNKDLISQQQRLAEKQLALPSQLRSEFSGGAIRNPLQQESIIQGRQSNIGSQLGTVGNLLSARKQNQSDILADALSTYQTRLAGEQSASENAWALYQDAVAREEAASAAAAQQAYYNSLLGDGTGDNIDDIDIETGDDTTEATDDRSFLQKYSDNNTIDPTNKNESLYRRLSSAISLNPFQQARNIGTYAGNLAGNWQNENMSFWDKLLNRR